MFNACAGSCFPKCCMTYVTRPAKIQSYGLVYFYFVQGYCVFIKLVICLSLPYCGIQKLKPSDSGQYSHKSVLSAILLKVSLVELIMSDLLLV